MRLSAAAAAETALAHIGNRMAGVLFGKRLVVRARRAAIVRDGDRVAPEQRRRLHRLNLVLQMMRGNRGRDVEMKASGRWAPDRQQLFATKLGPAAIKPLGGSPCLG